MSALPANSNYAPSPTTPSGVVKVTRYGWDVSQTEFSERAMVAKELLRADAYQRVDELSVATIHDIRRNFNAKRFGHLLVGRRRDGSLYLIDGLHRWTAVMERADIAEVPCEIVESAGQAEEAMLFVIRNSGQGRVTARQKYRALIIAGDKQAVAVDALLRRVGVQLTRSTNSVGGPYVKNISVLLRLHERDPQQLERCLVLMRQLMPSGTWPGAVMAGLVWLDSRIEGMDDALGNAGFVARVLDTGWETIRDVMDRFVMSQKKLRGGNGCDNTWGQGIFHALEAGRRPKQKRLRLTAAAAVEAMK